MIAERGMQRTPLFEAHQKLGGKLIEFGGWEMPVQYTSITDEHLAVRKAAGVFDISHMGEVSVRGVNAAAFLNRTLTNDIRKLEVGGGQYTLMCNERGGVVDDLYAYRLEAAEYLLIINASRIETDVAWLTEQQMGFDHQNDLEMRNISQSTAAIAVQGPKVVEFIDQVFPGKSSGGTLVSQVTDLKKNQAGVWLWTSKGESSRVWVARTGYTGEDGFEVVAPAEEIESIWNRLLAVGHPQGLKPAGLGARDTLRTEVCYPLYGNELDENTTPIEAGLGFFVALDKGEFTGRSAIAKQKSDGPARKLVAFRMLEKSAPPRPHYPICSEGATGEKIGEVVSGTQSPSLGTGIGMGYVPVQFAKAQTPIQIEIRNKRAPAQVVPKPFYRKAN
jgi:aminomethyltransferase